MESHSSSTVYRGIFADRQEAGRRLAGALMRYRDEKPVVVALFRGGVPAGYEIARALGAPLDVLFVRKLRAPGVSVPDPSHASPGAVADGATPQRFVDPAVVERLHIDQDYLDSETRIQLKIIEEQQRRYRGQRLPLELTGHTVIVVDDGIATGNTVRAGLQAIRAGEARHCVLAVPVAPLRTLLTLVGEVEDSVCLLMPNDFQSVDFYYADFAPIPDENLFEMLYKGCSPAGQAATGRGLRWEG
ncbi:hypothetical protein LZ012_16550 [Dechloromonas sp. XY25]|uniref:Phosphoribosyltransferase domain-containing protein n=1 Tax=Dechloromonas hankyongensis TaxID=2908002 RepID=A0ABS9K5Z9_9RHOO|nr:phosphoribosyltransferase family protein [Dechloromonas hankyongensis]MCG2578609.1 hypothetical protein [Dechloromonas hankyongensis]